VALEKVSLVISWLGAKGCNAAGIGCRAVGLRLDAAPAPEEAA
jgi:hypothetical protein